MGLSLFIEERNRASMRNIESNKEMFTGVPLTIKNTTEPIQHEVLLTLTQTMDSELNPEANCENYPTEDYKSYGDCDLQKIQQELKSEYNHLMPFWATKNLSSVTSFR